MNEILTGLGLSENLAIGVTIYGLLIVVAFWLAMVVWAYRDMRSRSRDVMAQIGMAVMVGVLTVPGLLIYLLLRPRETLSEAYERSLEEEALLQEIEEKPTCPGCGQHTKEHWQVCPHCHTRLKKACVHCRHLLDLSWQICPVCTAPQPGEAAPAVQRVSPAQEAAVGRQAQARQAIEFVEGDDYR